ncbi:glycosyltransferase [Allochromatium palmeri]|uniref:Glycosyltransferase n=1 Tax=Allochromatium palmeri TaxID=231048 RepID=A0A6N8EGA2_9GAMM|nr:glycosyltransferase [Allochromatium palmeri]
MNPTTTVDFWGWSQVYETSGLEMCPPERVGFVAEPGYLYNDLNPLSRHNARRAEQRAAEEWLQRMPQRPVYEQPLVSIVTTCKGRLDHLQQTIDRMLAQPQAQVVVVDYSCPQAVGNWVETCYPKARVVRIPGRQVYNASHSRNVGALQTATPWLLFVDADVLLAPDFLEQLLPRLQTSHSYHARPWIPSSMGTFLCTREAYDKIQGFDECMQGWGDEDRDFIARLSLAGYQADAYPVGLISIIEHSDALRMQNHVMSERQLSATINRTYISVKHDLRKR